ncbi:mediator complex subunit 25 von Willebrand factor type A-domain-containing protein [Halteromyces radiatus]|uniref:mediator complex subunit 25 von Willebrand factor type A-domain-containing protein n=1 Tax=Halteromyces radiatus TaxID=101107 RepID=UPI002220E450|nr:mediator complex subunit 25 von Willebrand factor type A-domain-containing protein [Halteromyces radiatus]KAI8097787.1 mediator complex subunit 25 von Willebrand factor type A-domain-containing protein [Halteromyces radiatus]
MATAIASTTMNTATTPGSQASPSASVPQSSPQLPTSHHHRKDVACVFVIDGSARMKPHLTTLYESYVDPILRQLRCPIISEGEDKLSKTRITPVLKYGLVVYGDYNPCSTVTVDRKYFTSELGLFQNILKSIQCKDGGILKNAAAEGLVAAMELFDDYREESDMVNQDPLLHCILVSNSLPYKTGVVNNLKDRYNNFTLDDIAAEMKKVL